MKTTAECYQALLDGETLVNEFGDKVIMIDGAVLFTGTKEPALAAFSKPENWQIYREPEWWEKIAEPVLCYVGTAGSNGLRLIEGKGPAFFIDVDECLWKHATPIPKEELLKMIAALEVVS